MHDPDLTAAVRSVVGRQVRDLTEIRREPIAYDAFLANRHVSRLRGTAATHAGPVDWSLVEKVTDAPTRASPYLYDNGLREFEAYRSGLLDDLAPGIAAPIAHGTRQTADGRLTLWLEDLDATGRRMGRDDVVAVARDLGRIAGRWLGRLPDEHWMFTGWLTRHGQPEAVAQARARLRSLRSLVAIERRLGRPLDEVEALIEAQPRIGSLLERLPKTLCHHDAVGANVFRRRHGEIEETVLIDWEMVGPGPVGADLVSLIFSSARRGDLPATAAVDLLPDALETYAAGMAEAGADTDVRTLGTAVRAGIALRWVLARDVIVALEDGTPVRRGSAPHETEAAAMTELVALTHLLFDAFRSVEPETRTV